MAPVRLLGLVPLFDRGGIGLGPELRAEGGGPADAILHVGLDLLVGTAVEGRDVGAWCGGGRTQFGTAPEEGGEGRVAQGVVAAVAAG